MLKIGLTGGIGSGKSTVAKVFEVLGAPVFKADDEARRLQNEDPAVKQAISDAFGPQLYASGKLDRAALAQIVFHDKEALAGLSAIVHPAVRKAFQAWCAERTSAPYVVMEAAILTETGGAAAFDKLVVVSAPEELRIQRVMERDGLGRDEVLARLKNQVDEATRRAKADHVIQNDGQTLVIPQVLELHRQLGNGAGAARDLPLSMVTFVFGILSIPLAFAVQLVSLAVVVAVLAILFNSWGRWKAKQATWSAVSLKRSRRGFLAACIGLGCAIVMWVLWASNVLLAH